jgi:hypothetical protein
LQNNLNRWYDPSVGRWLSEDPIGFAAGDANLHTYVGNTVLVALDPQGLACLVSYECWLKEEWKSPKSGELYCKYECDDVARKSTWGGVCDCQSPPVANIPPGGITGTHWRLAPRSRWPWSKPKCEPVAKLSEPFDFCPQRDRVFPLVDFKECITACGNVESARKICGLIKDPLVKKACQAAFAAGGAICENYCFNFQKAVGSAG